MAMLSLRSELTRLRSLLAEKQAQAEEDKIAIANLGKALNAALANKVQELQRFRSEFFGRLRTVLEGRSDVKIVGDRFVFQSEVLFAPGQASINLTAWPSWARLQMPSCRSSKISRLIFPGFCRLRAIQMMSLYLVSMPITGTYQLNGPCLLCVLWSAKACPQNGWPPPAMASFSQSPQETQTQTAEKQAD